jgi:purine-binding chemotaxis protein CheW
MAKNTKRTMPTLFYFQSDARRYCVPGEAVESIAWLPALSRLDGVPAWLVGLLNLHGQSVPVIDFSRFMGHAARPFSTQQKLLILQGGSKRVALIVDQVDDLKDWAGEWLPLHTTEQAGVLLGEIHQGDDMVMLVNAALLLDVPAHASTHEGCTEPLDWTSAAEEAQTFQTRRHRLAELLATEDVQGHVQFAIVSTGARSYAINLDQIAEFTHLRQYTFLPGSPASIVGCMNLRGEILAIVDMGFLAESEGSARNASVVVLNHQGHKFACLIQSIQRLVSVAESNVVTMHDSDEQHPLAKSLLRDGSDVTPILNLDAVMALCDPQQNIRPTFKKD